MLEKDVVFSRLNGIFQDVFDDEELTVTAATCADDVEDWDSLRHITLIAAVEGNFGMKFTMKEVVGMANVGEMADIIAARATK